MDLFNLSIHFKNIIPAKLKDLNMSVAQVERLAGLKRGVLQKILGGYTKNPTVNTLKAVAEALNLKVEDLMTQDNISEKNASDDEIQDFSKNIAIDYYDLLEECFTYVLAYLRNNNKKIKSENLFQVILKLYDHSLLKNKKCFDSEYAKLLLSYYFK